MPLTRRLIAVAAILVLGTTAVLAEDNGDGPPPCPGGTVKGKITCTGPVLTPTCTEGPPWTCTLDKDLPTAALDDGGTRPPRFPHFESLSGANSAGVFEPATGGGGGGKGPLGGVHGTFTTVMTTGGGPTIL